MTTGMPEQADLQQMTAKLLRLSQDSQRRATEFQQVSDRLADASVTERAENGAITVTVSSTGSLTDLRLTEAARELPADTLASAIMRSVQRAQAGIATAAQRIVDETVQDDSPEAQRLADRVVDTFRTNFPAPSDTAPATESDHGPGVGSLAEETDGDRARRTDTARRPDDDPPTDSGPIMG